MHPSSLPLSNPREQAAKHIKKVPIEKGQAAARRWGAERGPVKAGGGEALFPETVNDLFWQLQL
jgi:hypothetical protein